MHDCQDESVEDTNVNVILFFLLCKVTSSGFQFLIKTGQNRQKLRIQNLSGNYNPNAFC